VINPQLNTVLAGHGAGHFTLPDELTALVSAIRRLETARTEARREWNTHNAKLAGARQQAIDASIAGAKVGDPLPDASVVVEVEHHHHMLKSTAQLRQDAVNEASADLTNYLSAHSEEIIAFHLQPAHCECLAHARKCAETLGGLPVDASTVLTNGDTKAHRAYQELTKAHARFLAIRQAWLAIRGRSEDSYDAFILYRRPDKATDVGDIRTLEGFARAVVSDAEPWIATAAQASEAVRKWQEHGGDPIRTAQRRALEDHRDEVTLSL
jgi:hypothetical protein